MQFVAVRVFILGFIALLVSAAPLWAQGQAIDGIIEGFVREQADGGAIAGATVRAFNAATGYERSVLSDASGRYGMPLMPPGDYVVFVEAPQLATMSRDGLVLRAGQVLTVEFEMSTTAFSEKRAGDGRVADGGGWTHRAEQHLRRAHRARGADDRPQHPRLLRAAAGRERPADLERRVRHGHAQHGLRRPGPAADERRRRLEQPAGRRPQPGHQPGGRAGVPDRHQLLGRVRPRRRRPAERLHALGQQRAARLGLPVHAAGLAERASVPAGARRAEAGVRALQLRRARLAARSCAASRSTS